MLKMGLFCKLSRDGAVVKALASHQCGAGMIPGRQMRVEFVVGSRPCSEGFSLGSPVFLPLQKPTLQNSNSIWKQWTNSHSVEMPWQIPFLFIPILHPIIK